jgi:carboxymethylenebutenolidase
MNDAGFALSRRAFAVTALASGFAASVRPTAAQSPIKTSAEGLTAGEVKIPVRDGEIPAYRAMPASGGPFPTVLLIHEIWGVHEYFQDLCRRFAREGYCAVAPELFARQGDASKMTDVQAILRDIVSKVPDAQVMADLDATAAWAAKSSKGDPNELGVTGFCWGGRHTWLYAAHNPKLKAAVAWYGRVVGNPTELNPKHPIDVAAELKAPVLALYGGADSGIPVETVEKMRDAARAAGKTVELVVYPDAPHAFHADYRPSYRPEAAADGWRRCLAWFKQHGVA